jgi:L-malate glycosyltransferase
VHVSNFREVKRPRDVVTAFARSGVEESRLIMIGDGPEVPPCKDLANELGVLDRCTFVGTYDAIWDLLPQADVFFLPSEYESFGLSALEAMACAVPVVASNTGGLPEVVEHGVSGFLHTPGDTAAMGESIRKLLTNDVLRKQMGEAARETAQTKYKLEALLPVWEAYYERIMAQPPRP